jgi:hypothetical protein
MLRIARRFREAGRFINAHRMTWKEKGRFDNRPLKALATTAPLAAASPPSPRREAFEII